MSRPRVVVEIGAKLGRLTAIGSSMSTGAHPRPTTVVRCECGTELEVRTSMLARGHVKSCGCLRRELNAARMTTHGMGSAKPGRIVPEYRIWSGMVNRCEDPAFSDYHRYGGRGIRVCDQWRHDFVRFLSDVGPRPSPHHSLDRIDTNGHYEPGNVRWATATQQARNRRSNRMIEHDGQVRCMAEWCEITGVSQHLAEQRINKLGWDPARAITAPTRKRRTG